MKTTKIDEVKPVPGLAKVDKFTLDLPGGRVPVAVLAEEYASGGRAVQLVVAERCRLGGERVEAGEPVATVSVWVEESPALPPGCFYVKDYSENAEIIPQMVAQGVIKPAERLPTGGQIRARAYYLAGTCPFCGEDLQPGAGKCPCLAPRDEVWGWESWAGSMAS